MTRWSDLRVVATAEGPPPTIDFAVSPPVVQDREGARFVLRDVDAETPGRGALIRPDEFAENLTSGQFRALPGWSARRDHVLLCLASRALRALGTTVLGLRFAKALALPDGGCVYYTEGREARSFQLLAHATLMNVAREAFKAPPETLRPAEVASLETTLTLALQCATRGTGSERLAALAWVLFTKQHRPDRYDDALLSAARILRTAAVEDVAAVIAGWVSCPGSRLPAWPP